MKSKISLLMVLSLVLYALVGFADSGLTTTQTSSVNNEINQKIALMDQQLLQLNSDLVKLKAELASLYSLADSQKTDDSIKESDEDEDEDEDDDGDDGDDNGSKSDDDDNTIDGVTSATTTSLTADQLVRVNTLTAQIDTVDKQIKTLLTERAALIKSIEVKVVSPLMGSGSNSQGALLHLKKLGLNSIQLKGKTFKFDAPPVIKEGRTLVPVRALVEGLGATVDWDAITQTVTIQFEGKTLVFKLNQKTAWLNGKASTMEVVAESMENRTYVPIRFIAEQLGYKVNWLTASQSIELVKQTVAPVTVTPPVVVKPVVVPAPVVVPPVDTVSGATRKK